MIDKLLHNFLRLLEVKNASFHSISRQVSLHESQEKSIAHSDA